MEEPLKREWVNEASQLVERGTLAYVALKGSRLNGVAGPTSDVDLRGVFLVPAIDYCGLETPTQTYDRLWVSDTGDEMDIDLHEAKKFMSLLLNNNGNMVETLLVPEGYYSCNDRGAQLRELGPLFVTKKLYHFYQGYAQAQFKRACRQVKTGKGLIVTYRELFQGIHVLREGYHIFDLPTLAGEVQSMLGWESEVLPLCRRDRVELPEDLLRKAEREYTHLNWCLDQAFKGSDLPEKPKAHDQLNELLLTWRLGAVIEGKE